MGKYNKRPKLRSVKREKARKKDPIRRELKPLEAEEVKPVVGGGAPEVAPAPVAAPAAEEKVEKKRSKAFLFIILALIIILLLILFKTCSNDESETGDALTATTAETVTAITDSGSEEIPASEKSDEEELSAVSEMATSNEEDEIRESLSIAGIAVNIDSKDGSTVISYPEGISDEEVEAFLDDELEKYALVGIVSYEITEDGVVITYPEDVDEETRAEAIAILTEDLASYVNDEEKSEEITSAQTEEESTGEETSSEQVMAEEKEVSTEDVSEKEYPLIAVITAKDISSNVESYADHTAFTIPSSVSESDAAAFFDYEIERYGYEDTVTYEMEDGVLILSYPAPQKEEFREEGCFYLFNRLLILRSH